MPRAHRRRDARNETVLSSRVGRCEPSIRPIVIVTELTDRLHATLGTETNVHPWSHLFVTARPEGQYRVSPKKSQLHKIPPFPFPPSFPFFPLLSPFVSFPSPRSPFSLTLPFPSLFISSPFSSFHPPNPARRSGERC